MDSGAGLPRHFLPVATTLGACEANLELGVAFLETLVHVSLLLDATEWVSYVDGLKEAVFL